MKKSNRKRIDKRNKETFGIKLRYFDQLNTIKYLI